MFLSLEGKIPTLLTECHGIVCSCKIKNSLICSLIQFEIIIGGLHGQVCLFNIKGHNMGPKNSHVSIFHNPRCSKSRQTLQLIKDRGFEPMVIQYLKTPPDKHALNDILKLLNMEPRDLMRSKEKVYKELGLADPSLTRDELIEAMIQHPILIERPIVITNENAALGRPPEQVLKIL